MRGLPVGAAVASTEVAVPVSGATVLIVRALSTTCRESVKVAAGVALAAAAVKATLRDEQAPLETQTPAAPKMHISN